MEALNAVDNALERDAKCRVGQLVKGRLLCGLKREDEAVKAFRNAYRISRDIDVYEGPFLLSLGYL